MKILSLLCLSILILAACGGSSPTEGWTAYTSPTESFSLRIPPGTRVEDEVDSSVTFQLPTGARLVLGFFDKPADKIGDQRAIDDLAKKALGLGNDSVLVDSGAWTTPFEANYAEVINSDPISKTGLHALVMSTPLSESSHILAFVATMGKLTDEEKSLAKTIVSTLRPKE